jgi:hypothetical protein
MESKKINQLATELTPALSDLTIIGDPATGISKKITLSQMASLFTGTVEEYPSLASFPLVGVADTIYIALDTNVLYRWNTGTSAYVELSPNIINSLVFSDANGFDGNISLVGSVATLTITTALTTGSVPFIGASGALSQDNANLFFDDTNNRLGINTNSPTTALDVFGSGIIGRINGTSTNNAFLGFASAGSNKWSIGNVQSDHRFRIYNEATTSELVSVLQTGEFGIGIANPTTKFHIDGGASALIANLDANVSVAKSISFRSDNSNRINLEVSGTESGSNAGANFFLRAYSDAGALLNTPLTITRATGAATFISTVTASNGTLIGGSGSINSLPKFNSSNSLTDSLFTDNGTNGGFGGANYSSGTGVRTFNITASQFPGIGFWAGSTNVADIFGYETSGNLLIAADPTNVLTNSNLLFGVDGTTRLTIASDSSTFNGNIIYNNAGNQNLVITSGAPNNGRMYIYSAANANIGFQAGGSSWFLNNLGIGTNTPIATLNVFGTSGNPSMTADTNNLFSITGSLGPQLNIGGYNGASFGMWLQVKDANNTSINYPILLQPLGGSVGIGTASPGALLHVEGGTSGSSGRTRLKHATSGAQIDTYVGVSDGCGIIVNNNPLFFEVNSGERMRIRSDGNIGIGTAGSSNARLTVAGADASSSNYSVVFNNNTTTMFFVRNDGYMYFGLEANSPYNIAQSGRTCILASNGTVGYLSSTRESKTNIESIKNIDFINQLNPVQFNYRKKNDEINEYTDEFYDNITYGFIADEVEKINKELVFHNSDGTTLAGVDYNSMIAILTKAVQELTQKVNALENK